MKFLHDNKLKINIAIILIGIIFGLLISLIQLESEVAFFFTFSILLIIALIPLLIYIRRYKSNSIFFYTGLIVTSLLLIPFKGFEFINFHIRLIDFAFVIMALFFLVNFRSRKMEKFDIGIIMPIIGIIVYSCVLLLFQDYSIYNSLIDIIELFEVVFFIVFLDFILQKIDQKRLRKIGYYIFLISLAGACIRILFFFLTQQRFVGMWFLIGITTYGLYYSGLKFIKRPNIPSFILICIFVATIFLSRSRGTLFIIILVPLIYLVLRYRDIIKGYNIKRLFYLFSILIVVGLLISCFMPIISERISSIADQSQGFYIRPITWMAGIDILTYHPFGIGLKNFKPALQEQANNLFYPEWFVDIVGEEDIERTNGIIQTKGLGPHNDWISVLVGLGLIGLILYALFWIKVFSKIINSPINNPIAIVFSLMIIEYFLRSFIGNIFLTPNFYVLILFILLLRGSNHGKSKTKRDIDNNSNIQL